MNDRESVRGNRVRWILQIIVGSVFVFSAYSKLIMPGLIEIILVDHGFFGERSSAAFFVRMLIAGELAIGLLFFQKYFLKQIVIPLSILFLTVFTVYLVYTGFILKDAQNCGCFGELIKMSPVESIIKNVIFIVLIVILYGKTKKEKSNFLIPVMIAVFSFAAVFVAAPIKDLKEFRFKSYSYFERKGRIDLSSGEKIIAVFNLDCEHCQQTAKQIAELEKAGKKLPEVYILFFKEGNITPQMFDRITGSNFPYAMITAKEFFDLIGNSPPRLYWIKNGDIKEIWDKDFYKKITANFLNK
ncbi:MAG: hypothetical protein M1495_11845 [Bacteroidetes bacterium]|nr:hypothetical protein [Bacteroidota bacterium]